MPYQKDPRLLALRNNPKAYQNMYDQIAQVEGMYNQRRAEGMSREEALTTAYTGDELRQRKYGIEPGSTNYTVKTGDTVASVANNLNTTPDALLQTNPDVKKIQTGLVLNAPSPFENRRNSVNRMVTATPATPGSEAFRVGQSTSQAYAPTAPINNQVDPRTGLTRGVGAPASAFATKPTTLAGLYQDRQTSLNGLYQQIQSGATTDAFDRRNPVTQQPGQTIQPRQSASNLGKTSQPSHQTESRYVEDLFARTQSGYTPNQGELNYLLATNRISASPYANTPTPAYVKGAIKNTYQIPWQVKKGGRGGGSGGGGYEGRPAKYSYQDNNQPAFSGGGGFRGLVNWRI